MIRRYSWIITYMHNKELCVSKDRGRHEYHHIRNSYSVVVFLKLVFNSINEAIHIDQYAELDKY